MPQAGPQVGPQAGAYWVTTGVHTGSGSGHIQLQHPQPLKPIIAVTATAKMTILFIGPGSQGMGLSIGWEVWAGELGGEKLRLQVGTKQKTAQPYLPCNDVQTQQ